MQLVVHLHFAADVHISWPDSSSTCVVQLVIHLRFAADVHISWLDSRSAHVSPARHTFALCCGGTHKLARFELLGAALGAKWVTCGSVWVNFVGFAGSLGSLVLAGCMLWGFSFGLFVCIHVK